MSRDSPHIPPPELRDAFGPEMHEQTSDEKDPTLDKLWSLLETAKAPSSTLPDASETWAGVKRHIEAETESADRHDQAEDRRAQRSSRTRTRRWVGWRGIAAAVVVFMGALGAWLWSQPVTVTAAPGAPVSRTLPDGSTVELNGGTHLTYPRTLSTVSFLEAPQRTVQVRGEAYFEVQSAERPFVVRTQTARIEVVGTAFAVHTDERSAQTHVAVAEGSVQVHGTSVSERALILEPGQALRIGPEGLASAPADTSFERVTAWRRGGFAVTAQPLPAIAQALEQQYGAPIRLSSSIPTDVTSSPLTLYYSQDVGVETILHDISMARDLSYRPTPDDGYVLALAESSSRSPSGPNK